MAKTRIDIEKIALIGFLLFLAFPALCGSTPNSRSEDNRPNVLLLTVDTLRADHLSSYGYPRQTSLHFDAIAHPGVLFKSARCNWPKTTPSFVSMLTGTFGHTNLVRGGCRQKLPLDLTTIAEVMKKNGYQTGGIVSNANLGVAFQFDQGFDDYIEIWEEPSPADAISVTDHAIEWLKTNKDKPFFLWVHYLDPHARYQPKAPFDKMFLNDEIYKKNDKILRVGKNTYTKISKKNTSLGDHVNLNYYLAQYDGEIAFVDSQIERILAEMEKQQIYNNTLKIVTSDHGEELGEHRYYFEHGIQVFETTMHVPLIINYPDKIEKPIAVDDTVSLVRLFPTVLDYCGIEPIEQLEGSSLRPIIEGKEKVISEVFLEGGYQNRTTKKYHSVVYEGDWKLIHYSAGHYALFNLAEDPGEKNDLAAKETEVAQRLTKKLSGFEKLEKEEAAVHKEGNAKMSGETVEQLKALGYVE